MLKTYIKNRGITETIFQDNHKNHINKVEWDADYDGNKANIRLDTNTDGKRKHYNVSLNNEDLADILGIEGVQMPIDRRLQMDFQQPNYVERDYFIELPLKETLSDSPSSIEEIIADHISSPKSDEEFIVPVTIDRKTSDKYTLTPRKKHRRRKSHVTHKIYKKPKSSSKSSSRKRKSSKTSSSKSKKSRRKSYRNTSIPQLELF